LIEKTKEREAAELSTIYGMGTQHKEKLLEGIRELEQEHDEEARNCSPNHGRGLRKSQGS
jgi:hypothetical protein